MVRGAVMGRTVLDREAVHVADLQAETEEFPEGSAIARQLGFHTLLCVPLMREGSAIGAIGLRRIEVSPFTDKQIALAKTFADQAVIAIENVRLFTELQEKNKALTAAHAQVTEALEQQTATSEILRIISQSPTQVEPVFHALIASAIRLARGDYGGIELLQNDVWYLAASEGLGEGLATFRRIFPLSLEQSGLMKDAVTTRTPMHTPNVFEDPRVGPFARQLASAARYHALIHVPLLGRDVVMGLLTVLKREPGPFAPNEVALLQTFADQAVIAIENTRLFTELQTSNRELTTALDQQTATSEILRAISSSLSDVQPVFNTIVQSGLRLLGGYSASMMLLRDDGRLDLVAYTSTSAEADSSLVDAFPMPLRRVPPGERAIHERRAYAVEDVESAPDATDVMRETGRARGWRSNLFVPMIRDDVAVGLISITRRDQGRSEPIRSLCSKSSPLTP